MQPTSSAGTTQTGPAFRVLFVDPQGLAITDPIGWVSACMLARAMNDGGKRALILQNNRGRQSACEQLAKPNRIERVTLALPCTCESCAALALHLRAIRLAPSDLAAVGSSQLPPQFTESSVVSIPFNSVITAVVGPPIVKVGFLQELPIPPPPAAASPVSTETAEETVALQPPARPPLWVRQLHNSVMTILVVILGAIVGSILKRWIEQ